MKNNTSSTYTRPDENDLVARYLKPIFAFCLRRTQNRTKAEELASEIMVEALSSLQNGYNSNS